MRVAGAAAACGIVLGATVAVLHVGLPPNEEPRDGAADPFLRVRRPVLRALEALPFLGFRSKRYLPSSSDGMTTEGTNEHPVCRQEITREPVYRGLFWRAGRRVTYRLTYFRDHDEKWQVARLCYVVGSEAVVAAENPTPDPQRLEVAGFVPRSARGYWVEYTDDKGDTHWLNTWGQTEPFADDSRASPRAPPERRRVGR